MLVPLSDSPMSPELAEELAQWQALSAETWEMFPYQLTKRGENGMENTGSE